MPTKNLDQLPDREELEYVARVARAAKQTQQEADDLKQKALVTTDTQERDTLLKESRQEEAEARKHSKEARRMASGAWQGAAHGAGIGVAVGGGLGTVTGTLVGTLAAIPTTGLGTLIGIPVGMIHGPWMKADDGPGRPSQEEATEEQQHRAVLEAVEAAEEHDRDQ